MIHGWKYGHLISTHIFVCLYIPLTYQHNRAVIKYKICINTIEQHQSAIQMDLISIEGIEVNVLMTDPVPSMVNIHSNHLIRRDAIKGVSIITDIIEFNKKSYAGIIIRVDTDIGSITVSTFGYTRITNSEQIPKITEEHTKVLNRIRDKCFSVSVPLVDLLS